jgi:hypothetical protein
LRHAPDPAVTLDAHETLLGFGNWVILQFGNLRAATRSEGNSGRDGFQITKLPDYKITKFLAAGAAILRD